MRGPMVYVVMSSHHHVVYVGQTTTSLRQRFRTHLRDPAKAGKFEYVAALRFNPSVPGHYLDAAERMAHIVMAPEMGSGRPRAVRG